MEYQELIDQMTLEEKASLLSGKDNWHTKAIDRLGIPSIMMTDGPHGLRKQTEENFGIHDSVKATCYPTAVTVASSWDTSLAYKMGEAIGDEALAENVAIVLGPGVNIKRSPLCGRNFEYFSEDPYLAGHLASGFIDGVQSKGVGTSLKHFAGNSQETRRMTVSDVIDMRTLREIYLTQFEIAVKHSHPMTLMCSYNKINEVYSSDNKMLLRKILRDEWGYQGVVMSDWGAVNNRPVGVEAGLDLEMPSSGGYNDEKIVSAVENGMLDIKYVDEAVDNMLHLIFTTYNNQLKGYHYDIAKHDKISEDIATESAVLLKNDGGLLPLDKNEKILVIGALAKNPRYQGAGSSHICAHKTTSLLQGLDRLGVQYEYTDGYTMRSKDKSDKKLIEAIEKAQQYEKILLCVGLTDEYEAEGFDRNNLELPISHTNLINAIGSLSGKKIALNIECGAPITMPWIDKVDSILLSYLGGQSTGGAAARLLYGEDVPSGKLAETFPIKLEDNPSYHYFPGNFKYVEYREGVYVGYRYYLTAGQKVLFPFGYGLSYTTFVYNSIEIDKAEYHVGDKVKFKVNIGNIGELAGKEIVEVYIHPHNPMIDRPIRELKAFKKVYIDKGDNVDITFELDKRAFAYYDVDSKDFVVDKGKYDIIVARNAEDTSLVTTIEFLDGNEIDKHLSPNSWYNHPSGNVISDEDFSELYGTIPKAGNLPKKGEFTKYCCFADMMPASWLARRISGISKMGLRSAMHLPKNDPGLEMLHKTFLYSPLRSIAATSQNIISNDGVNGIVTILNGHFFKGLHQTLKDVRTQSKKKKGKQKAEQKK